MAAWPKGTTGNPNGRRGRPVSDAGRAKLREAIAKNVPAIVKKLTTLAKAGDVQAARTLLERVLPPLRAQSSRVQLPEVAAATTLTEQAALIVKAVALGELLPDDAKQLLDGIGLAARITEIDELKRRIDELEQKATS